MFSDWPEERYPYEEEDILAYLLPYCIFNLCILTFQVEFSCFAS